MSNEMKNTNEAEESTIPMVEFYEGKPMTTSLNVAEVFGKRHDHVLRDIRELGQAEDGSAPSFGGWNEFSALNFEESTYIGDDGKEHSMVEMTRDGFALLAMGFTGQRALEWKIRYIAAFNDLEALALVKASQFSTVERSRAVKRDSQLRLAYSKQIDALGKSLESCWDKARRAVLHQDIVYLCGITGMQAPILADFGINVKQQAMDI